MREHYCDVPVYVMANGVEEDPARFKDSLRVYYLYNYINEALKGETTKTQHTEAPIIFITACVHKVINPSEVIEVFPSLASAELNN